MKTVVITGVSRGIGKALAQKFLDNDYFVIGTSTSGTSDFRHNNMVVVQLDLFDSQSIQHCEEKIKKMEKGIDLLINNAAISIDAEEESPVMVAEYLRKTLEVNLIGTVDFTEKIIPLIHTPGSIINISSRAGSLAHMGYTLNAPAYRISKAGLNMVTRILAKRLEGKITVSSVHPGWVRTDMGGSDADYSPEEVADDIFKLATSEIESGQFWYKGEKFPW